MNAMTPIKVAIIGAGNVGCILGAALLTSSDQTFIVKYGVRNVPKHRKVLDTHPRASIATVTDACTYADVIILAVPGSHENSGIQRIAESLGPGAENKPIIDATNPLSSYPNLEIRWTGAESGGEHLSKCLPKSHVYKAFNTIGAEHMQNPVINDQKLTMLFAGPKEDGKDVVEKVIAGVGFLPVYVGPIRYARNLEAIAELWIHLGTAAGFTDVSMGRQFHFQIIKE